MSENVTLNLTRDEAIVFFDWLARFNGEKAGQFEDQAEQRVLWVGQRLHHVPHALNVTYEVAP